MIEEEIRRIVRESVLQALEEWVPRVYAERLLYREREITEELNAQVMRLSFTADKLEKSWAKVPSCGYDKAAIDSIKADTSRIR